MADRKLSRRGRTQIDDIPSCLIIDILSRVPIETLVNSRFVCKSWFVLFKDPLFVRLHRARSPTCFFSGGSELNKNLKCYKSVGAMVGKDFEIDFKAVMKADSVFICYSSCHGLLCLSRGNSIDEIYVCNPILGEYITIPTVNKGSLDIVNSFLGFSSRSNQFKVLQISYSSGHMGAQIYTIGNGTRQWKSIIGIAPSCTFQSHYDSVNSFLNGSIHWTDEHPQQFVYFDFESEKFGSLPSPPSLCADSIMRVFVLDGCLCIYAFGFEESHDGSPTIIEQWVMKEYGVEESWTKIWATQKDLTDPDPLGVTFPTPVDTIAYNPSFISLQDVAGSENLTVLSRTRTNDQDSLELNSNHIFLLEW